MRPILLFVMLMSVWFVVGSASAEPAVQPGSAPTSPPVAAWPKPIELPIRIPPSGPSQEWMQLSIVWGKGLVGGTPAAIASIGRPLAGLEGHSRVVAACKKAVWDRASEAGAESIEAVQQDTDRRTRKGRIFAPVAMRLSYAKPNMVEVKTSTVICVVDRAGHFVDAYTPEATPSPASYPSATTWSRLRIAAGSGGRPNP